MSITFDIVNISLSILPGKRNNNIEFFKFVRELVNKNIVVVVAAGNCGPLINTLNPLATIPGVISVGATTRDGKELLSYSSRGIPNDYYYVPTVVAPGEDIPVKGSQKINKYSLCTYPSKEEMFDLYGQHISNSKNNLNYYYTVNGTSFSCSLVSGIVGRLIEMRKKLWLPYNNHLMKEIIKVIAKPMNGYQEHEVGCGLVTAKIVREYFQRIDSLTFEDMYWKNNKNLTELWDKSSGKGITIGSFG